jgi:hypothetical protein
MKRALSCIVSALAAVSFTGLVSAAEYPATDTGSTDYQSPATSNPSVNEDTGTSAAPMKKDMKKKKRVRRWSEGSGMATGGGTGPNYGTAPLGGPSGNGMGDPNPTDTDTGK